MKSLLLSLVALSAQGQIYDILIKNGQVIDPANGRNGKMDIAIVARKIAKVGLNLPVKNARVVIDADNYVVTPGFIDLHTHIDSQGASLNVNPDHNCLPSGATTCVDAGSSGADNFEAFRKKVIDRSQTRVLAFLNIVAAGMYGPQLENDPKQANVEKAVETVNRNKDVIVGIKTAHYEGPGWTTIDNAIEAARRTNTICMVDTRPMPEHPYPELITSHMRPGDIHTHFYGKRIPQIDAEKKIQPYVIEARKRGVLFDVGHGSGSFYFSIAIPAIKQGFLPDTISTDLHKESIMLSRANMILTLSKFINIGMTLEQVIERATVNPAKAIHRTDLGTLSEGSVADVAIIAQETGEFAYLDSGRNKLTANKRLRCALTIRNGKVVWDEDGLSLSDWQQAGPYTNFK